MKADTRPAGTARLRLPVLVASGLGSGFSRIAPGTAGSFAALLCGILLIGQPYVLLLSILAACAAGLWSIPRASGGADHGWIVIDEIAGQWITLLGIPTLHHLDRGGVAWLLAAFAMFRLLDITKPGPIGTLDRRHDAIGVMGDDILAGMLGALLLGLIRLLRHGMGSA